MQEHFAIEAAVVQATAKVSPATNEIIVPVLSAASINDGEFAAVLNGLFAFRADQPLSIDFQHHYWFPVCTAPASYVRTHATADPFWKVAAGTLTDFSMLRETRQLVGGCHLLFRRMSLGHSLQSSNHIYYLLHSWCDTIFAESIRQDNSTATRILARACGRVISKIRNTITWDSEIERWITCVQGVINRLVVPIADNGTGESLVAVRLLLNATAETSLPPTGSEEARRYSVAIMANRAMDSLISFADTDEISSMYKCIWYLLKSAHVLSLELDLVGFLSEQFLRLSDC